ncbi:MAG: YaaA family protein, partial [Dysgonamonadaceae bacterium]|nr:YaaA family protein [Dysgonamonadaceae bacterium]MDD4246883.1 YaaA family protein [Dysgonamonadaceae bacterium]HUI33352.1 YaaA family protein [Dysgonamonadaceae bacterium]
MQLLLSPAKLMNFREMPETIKGTTPLFLQKTNELVDFCQLLSVSDFAKLLKISPKMAHDVYGYFQTYHLDIAPQRCAAFAFNGIAFQGLNAHDFSDEDLEFAQSHLNIASGLYGLLRPLDLIKPYRLDVCTRISPIEMKINNYGNLSSIYPKSNYLYGFWQKTVNQYLSEKLSEDDNTIINLSSSEYYKIIVPELLPDKMRMITIAFREQKENQLKQVIVYAKKARGQMARFIIKNKIMKAEDIKGFDWDGYFYYPAQSTPTEWVFVR